MRGDIAISTDNQSLSLKKVSWETLQNLCQVRLFAAEDAPSLLGTTLQELYQAKETKFLHAAEPVSESDMPPGFVNFAVRQIGGGANPKIDMETQVHWRCPEKFLLKAGWQVAAGNQSIEASAEKRRELGVPEATYLHLNLMPVSPGEPQETSSETKDSVVLEIPLFSVEDDDELEEGFNPGGEAAQSLRKAFEKPESQERPSSLLSDSSASSSAWPTGQPDQSASSSFMSDADPNVAAAAAAAYAVLKAKERGALVDHDLLIKILTNPILIKTLLASKQNMGLQLRDLSRAISEGQGKAVVDNELERSLGNAFMGSSLLSLPVPTGSKMSVPAVQSMPEANIIQTWNMSSHFENSRPFMGSRAEESFYGRSEMPGSGLGTSGMGVPPSQMLPHRQDVLKDLIHQHGMERSRNEGLSRGLPEMEFIGSAKPLCVTERHRTPVMGPFSQLGPGGQHGGASTHGRGEGFLHARYGNEPSQSRFQKPCIYFNTPKGCRRGTSCFYLHTSVPERPFADQPRPEFFPFPSAKRPKFGMPDRD